MLFVLGCFTFLLLVFVLCGFCFRIVCVVVMVWLACFLLNGLGLFYLYDFLFILCLFAFRWFLL